MKFEEFFNKQMENSAFRAAWEEMLPEMERETAQIKRQVRRNEVTNRVIVLLLALVLLVLIASFVLLGWLILRPEPMMQFQVMPIVPQAVPVLVVMAC